MPPPNERPTAFHIARRSWISLFQAARQMPLLFLGCFALLLASEYAGGWLAAVTPSAGDQNWTKNPLVLSPAFWRGLSLIVFSSLLTAIVLAALAVAVHRFVLLGQVCKSAFFVNQTSLQFAALATLFQMVPIMLSLFTPGRNPSVEFLIKAVYWALLCWTVMVFPSLAVKEPIECFSRRLDTAIGRAQGRFWLIVRSLILAIAPIVIAVMVLGTVMIYLNYPNKGAPLPHMPDWSLMLLNYLPVIFGTAIGAATASWLYRYATQRPPPDHAAC